MCVKAIKGGLKLWRIPACLLSSYMLQGIVTIWMIQFGESPVVPQVVFYCQNLCYTVYSVQLEVTLFTCTS